MCQLPLPRNTVAEGQITEGGVLKPTQHPLGVPMLLSPQSRAVLFLMTALSLSPHSGPGHTFPTGFVGLKGEAYKHTVVSLSSAL